MFESPDGQKVLASGTPGGGRGQSNNEARLKAAGLQDNYSDPGREKRVKSAKDDSQVVHVLQVMQDKPQTPFTPAQIGKQLGLAPSQVSHSLYWLKTNHPEVRQAGRGLYTWVPLDVASGGSWQEGDPIPEEPEADYVFADEPDLLEPDLLEGVDLQRAEAARLGLAGLVIDVGTNGTHAALAEAQAVAAAPAPEIVETPPHQINVVPAPPTHSPSLFEAVSRDGGGRLIVRDEFGEHYLCIRMVPEL
jgi:hypothetical protein